MRPIKAPTPRAVLLLLLTIVTVDVTSAYGYDGAATVTGTDRRSRGTWAALLVGYIALGAITTGGAYFLRDNLFGRTVAVSAAGWGGLTVGAGTGYGLARLRTCGDSASSSAAVAIDCSDAQEVATAVGGILGAVAGSIAGHFLASEPGMSRPYVAAAGLAPALLFLSVGTITDW